MPFGNNYNLHLLSLVQLPMVTSKRSPLYTRGEATDWKAGGKPKIWHAVHGQQSELLHLSQQQPQHMDHGYYGVLSGKVAVD